MCGVQEKNARLRAEYNYEEDIIVYSIFRWL